LEFVGCSREEARQAIDRVAQNIERLSRMQEQANVYVTQRKYVLSIRYVWQGSHQTYCHMYAYTHLTAQLSSLATVRKVSWLQNNVFTVHTIL
jgi:hypothetical protein